MKNTNTIINNLVWLSICKKMDLKPEKSQKERFVEWLQKMNHIAVNDFAKREEMCNALQKIQEF